MFKRSTFAAGLLASLVAGTAAPLAAAAPPLAITVPAAMPLAAVGLSEIACAPLGAQVNAQMQSSHPLAARTTSARMAKNAAILGGRVSALDRMRMAQAGQSPAMAQPLAPQTASSPQQASACAALGLRSAAPGASEVLSASYAVTGTTTTMGRWPTARTAGRFLGTERIRIGRTRFDAQWQRVAAQRLSAREVRRALGHVPDDRAQLMATVNRWVNRSLTYRRDPAQFGRRDYWADARTTLRNRAGDCEDYAILKMQMLAAAGIAREDMMLTLARDTLRRSDHAVLLVRDRGEWFMLDMASDRVAPAAADYGYRPVMSFAAGQSYIHGTPMDDAHAMRRTIRIAYN